MLIPIDRLVRSRRKTIALIVEKDGGLTVRAPLRLPDNEIRKFVELHSDWIIKNQRRAQRTSPPPPKSYVNGETFLLLGKPYPLEIVPSQRLNLQFDGSTFRLAQASLPRAGEVFTRWYKKRALQVFSEKVAHLAIQHNFTYTRVRVSSARTRWGSCSSRGTLSFTWRLVMAPPEVIDYVILHELVHTRIKNHSKTFWSSVAELMPNYKLHVRWLKTNGQKLAL